MKKLLKLLLSLVLAMFLSLVLGERVKATVGGPTFISQIAFKASENTVYYVENDHSGRGCPPIIHAIDLSDNKNTEVMTCDEVFQKYYKDYSDENFKKYTQFITDTFKNMRYLASVSLNKNNIDIQVEALSDHFEYGDKAWMDFRATLTQDNQELAKLDFRGCTKDQPHLFEGYMIPDSDKMLMLVSNVGDCFEGGYTRESLFVVENIKYYDTKMIRGYKTEAVSEPNSGNMIVYAGLTSQKDPSSEKVSPAPILVPEENKTPWLILFTGIGLVFGVGVGYVWGRKSVRSLESINTVNK